MDKMINMQFQMRNASCIVYIVFHAFSKYPQALELSTKLLSRLLVCVCVWPPLSLLHLVAEFLCVGVTATARNRPGHSGKHKGPTHPLTDTENIEFSST